MIATRREGICKAADFIGCDDTFGGSSSCLWLGKGGASNSLCSSTGAPMLLGPLQFALRFNIHPLMVVAGKSRDFVESLLEKTEGDAVI